MMHSLIRDLVLAVKRNLGASPGIAVWALLAAICAVASVIFLSIAAYTWLALRYDALTASLALGGAFLFVTLAMAVACIISRRRLMAQKPEQSEVAKHAAEFLADPRVLSAGLQMGRTVGFKRLLPLMIIGAFAFLSAKETSRSGGARQPAE